MFLKEFSIDGQKISESSPPYIIAEMSANHGGKISRAKNIIKLSKDCGANAVKIQVYEPSSLTIDCHKKHFLIDKKFKWKDKSLYDLYSEAKTPKEWVPELMSYAKKIGITLFASVFDIDTVKYLKQLKIPAFKIASFEANYHELIAECVKTNKPVIISTGLCNKKEISEIIKIVKKNSGKKLILLKCVSSYPTPLSYSNLSLINQMKIDFKVNVGLSDHTLGLEASKAASILGACVIEKHFIDDKRKKTPDSFFSIGPKELKKLVEESKKGFILRGNCKYGPSDYEKDSLVFRRSIFVTKNIQIGENFSHSNLAVIRPGNGIQPKFLNKIVGKIANKALTRGTPLKWEDIK